MGKKGPILLMGFSILVLIFMAWVSTLPDVVAVENTVSYPTSSVENISVQKYLSEANNWKKGLFLNEDSKVRFMPLKNGFKWFSDSEGDGALEFKILNKNEISYQLITDNGQFRNRGVYLFDEINGNTKVTWMDSLDVSTSFFARWSAREEGFLVRISTKNQKTLEQLINNVVVANSTVDKKQVK